MLAIQCDLFESNDEVSLLRKELAIVKKQTENVRRGLFARHNEMMKMLLKQQDELDKIRGSKHVDILELFS